MIKNNEQITFSKNILFLSKNPMMVRAQLKERKTYTLTQAKPLRDNISTDEISPVPIMYNFDEKLKHYPYTGFQTKGITPILRDDILNADVEVVVAGERYGKGSSREHSPLAEFSAGIRLVVAKSFETIYRQNADNIGLLTSTDFSLISRIEKGESISIDDIVQGRDFLTSSIIKIGGLISYGRQQRSHQNESKIYLETPHLPKTYLEKILARHKKDEAFPCKPGQGGFIQPDWRFTHEAYSGMAMHLLKLTYGQALKLHDPQSIILFEDHFAYRHRSKIHANNNLIPHFDALAHEHANFVNEYPVKSYGRLEGEEGSEGISHSLIAEKYALPGDIIVGTESHTTHSGALGCFAFGTGTTNLANAMVTGMVQYTVPDVMKIELTGAPRTDITAKDIALVLLSTPFIRSGKAIGKVIEFSGPVISAMNMDERLTLTNMVNEMGGFSGIIAPDEETLRYLKEHRHVEFKIESWMKSDIDAYYADKIELNCSDITPMLASPGDPGNGIEIGALTTPVKIDIAYGGSCTAGKCADFDYYYSVLSWAYKHNLKIAPHVTLFLQTGSIDVRKYCEKQGYLELFNKFGVEVLNPQCAACCNCGPGASENKEQVTISSINRNFPGRSGPGKVWLASPPTIVASAIAGKIMSFKQLQHEHSKRII